MYEIWNKFRLSIVFDDDKARNKSLLLKIAPFYWFYLLSHFDDLEFPKAETFAKMTEKREKRES